MSGISEDGEEVRGFPKPAGHDQSAKHHFRHLRAKRRGGVQAMRARVPQRLLRSDTYARCSAGLVCRETERRFPREERFLSTQADRFAGAKREEKASACSVRNDGGGRDE